MKTKNPFDFDSIKAHVQNRNAFDVSYSTMFTSPCGMILPAYVEEVLAGDYFELGMENFTRTQPAVAPAFVNFDEKVDFYFVPYRLLWSLYDSWRVGTNVYNKSSLSNSVSYNYTTNMYEVKSMSSDITLPSVSYGKFFDLLYNELFKNVTFDGIDKNSFGFPVIYDVQRMCDMLGYGSQLFGVGSSLSDPETQPWYLYYGKDSKVNIMRFLAYQCIIQHYFRNEDFEPYNVASFNVDESTTISQGFVPYYDSVHVCNNYVKWTSPAYKIFRKDRFNSVKPINGFGYNSLQLLAGDVSWIERLWSSSDSALSVNNESFRSESGLISDVEEVGGSYYGNKLGENNTIQGWNLSGNNKYGTFGISPNDLRVLLANDSMLRSMVYSKKDYASLFEAQLGISTRNYEFPLYLGTHSSAITLSDVEATINNDNTVLGELAGKGVGGNNGFIFKRDFDEDGVILGLHYIMPRNNYNSYRLDRKNVVLSRYDLPMPQFDNLGLQPVWLWEYGLADVYTGIAQYINGDTSPDFSLAFGYESRYGQYKSRVNEIHGIFQSGQSLDYWTLSTNVGSDAYKDKNVDLVKYKLANGLLSDSFFKIRPNITDQVFNVTYDGTEETDPFLCTMSFNVTRVSNLSVMGVPSVNTQI